MQITVWRKVDVAREMGWTRQNIGVRLAHKSLPACDVISPDGTDVGWTPEVIVPAMRRIIGEREK